MDQIGEITINEDGFMLKFDVLKSELQGSHFATEGISYHRDVSYFENKNVTKPRTKLDVLG